jgi:SpoVK/Ycf46/Vps4 family AAA+-type ATPase
VGEVCDWRLVDIADEASFLDSYFEPGSKNFDLSPLPSFSQHEKIATLTHSLKLSTPPISFADIVGNGAAKASLSQFRKWRREYEESSRLHSLGVRPPTGVLLYGPPGTGKTLLARAIATSVNARFISVPLPAVLRADVGESERALASAFAFAQAAAPSVLFFDEIQSLFTSRGGTSSGASDESDRMASLLTSQLLSSLDALASKHNGGGGFFLVVAATNRLDLIDAALLQPGRFDLTVLVPLPSENERAELFASLLSKSRIFDNFAGSPTADISRIASDLAARTHGFSGAAVASTARLAATKALLQWRASRTTTYPVLDESHFFSACSELAINT